MAVQSLGDLKDNRRTQARIKMSIPKHLQREPIISRLVAVYRVTVNIITASLDEDTNDEAIFELELRGTSAEIQSALTFLHELDVGIQHLAYPEQDGW